VQRNTSLDPAIRFDRGAGGFKHCSRCRWYARRHTLQSLWRVPLTLRRSNSVIGFVSRQVRQVMVAAEASSSNANPPYGLGATISDIEQMV